jgi:Transcription factor Tfb2
VDIAFLDVYATKQWEMILHFLVGTDMSEGPGGGVLQLLKQATLMEGDPLYLYDFFVVTDPQKPKKYANYPLGLRVSYARYQRSVMDTAITVLGTQHHVEHGSR